MDPPYKEKNLSSILNNVNDSNILHRDGIIIIHRHKKEEDEFPEKFNIIEEKNYGISKVIFGSFFKKEFFLFLFLLIHKLAFHKYLYL